MAINKRLISISGRQVFFSVLFMGCHFEHLIYAFSP